MSPLHNAPDDDLPSPVASSLSRILRNSGNQPLRGQKPCSLNLGKTAIRIWTGTLSLDYDFHSAVALLERWLNQYQAQQAKKKPPTAPPVS
jgi:hypothetical protein